MIARSASGCVVASLICIGGCAVTVYHSPTAEATKAAEQQARKLFEALTAGNIDSALEAYSPLFLDRVGQKWWRAHLVERQKLVGQCKGYQLVRDGAASQVGGESHITLVYRVFYDRETRVERLVFNRSADGVPKIIDQHVEGDAPPSAN